MSEPQQLQFEAPPEAPRGVATNDTTMSPSAAT